MTNRVKAKYKDPYHIILLYYMDMDYIALLLIKDVYSVEYRSMTSTLKIDINELGVSCGEKTPGFQISHHIFSKRRTQQGGLPCREIRKNESGRSRCETEKYTHTPEQHT